MSNSCSETLQSLQSLHFPEAIQHNFVLEFHTHSIAPTPRRTHSWIYKRGGGVEFSKKRGGFQIFPIKVDGLVK